MANEAQLAKSIFLDLVEQHPPNQWDQHLAEACKGDAELRHQVEILLKAHAADDSLLDMPNDDPGWTVACGPLAEGPGTIIGPYKLLQQIGEGGMGVVFMAEQLRPVERKVALKIIKPGMDTRQVIARFEAERKALALMDHPNIAKIHDAGTTGEGMGNAESGTRQQARPGAGSVRSEEENGLSTPNSELRPRHSIGRPFFVMELVKGVPITIYCDEKHLSLKERLELFIPVCQAVQHAHQKGIIHRDLKPTNVLVAEYDNEAVPKVIDFGVAKATVHKLTERTMFTQFGQVVGTIEYMSPEQAKLNQLDIDTRSDIYSLGVLLYELLTGATPFDRERLRSAAFDEMLRIIREDEPVRPSTRLSSSETLGAIAANRNVDAARLPKQVRGELDWIVMKSLEKDRSRRYETANGLALDVQRYLNDDPVLACPPSAAYRLRKFARRNKAALLMATVATSALLLTIAALAVSTIRIAGEQQTTKVALAAEIKAKGDLQQTLLRERRDAYFHRITLVQRELSMDNLGRTLQLLDECPKDLRGWEWYYLMRLCRVEPLVLRDTTEANGVTFSADGQRLASACGDGTVKIWNSRTGHLIQTFKAHTDSVASVAFHPDGKHVASAGADRKVKVWDLTTGQEVFSRPCDAILRFGTAYTVAFSPPDGRQLAAGSEGAVTLWDWKNRQPFQIFRGHELHSIPVAFSRDGQRLATGGAHREGMKLWDAETGGGGMPLRSFPAHRYPISAVAFSPDGGRLASASADRSVKVWDTTTGRLLHTFLHTGNVHSVAFSSDGRCLAAGGNDATVRVWDATTGRELLGLRGHTGTCGCVAFSPDGRRLASASTDGTIRFWDATPLRGNEGQETLSFTHSNEILTVALSPDGDRVVSAGFDSSASLNPLVEVWDAQTGEVSLEFSGHTDVVFGVAWHPDGQRVASAGSGKDRQHSVSVWDARTGEEVFALKVGRKRFEVPYSAVAFSPDGRYLVTGRINGAVQVWNAGTGQEVATLGTHNRAVRAVVFSRDGLHLASMSADGIVKLWDATRLDEKQEPRITVYGRVPGASVNVAISPNGRLLAMGSDENTFKIWDVEKGDALHTQRGHSGDVYTVAFSPDDGGRWVASGGEDSTVKVWDSRTGKLLKSFRGHTGLVTSVAFSPDGRRLYSGSQDHTVKVWDLAHLSEAPDR